MTIGVLMSKGAARYSNQTNRRYFIDKSKDTQDWSAVFVAHLMFLTS